MSDRVRTVLVAGAGYGGINAARHLARAGVDTLVVDRRNRAGWPPQSTSGLAKLWVRTYDLPTGGESTPITGFRLYGPDGAGVALGGGILGEAGEVMVEHDVVARMERQAVDAGAEVVHGETVLRVERCDGGWFAHLHPSGRLVTCHNILDATGFQAWIGRQLGMVVEPDPEDMAGGVEITVPRPDIHPPGEVRMWLSHTVAPNGYAWAFPSVEDGVPHVRVGLGTPRSDSESAGQYFRRFRAAHPEYGGAVHHRTGGIIPVAPVARALHRDGVYLLGDAGRLCCPVTGGGIWGAIASGEAAAGCIVDRDPDSYRARLGPLLRTLRLRWMLKQLAFGLDEDELGGLVEFLGGLDLPHDGNIDPVIVGRQVARRFFLTRPGLAATILHRGRFWRAVRAGS
jgi:flavin-dependent dehydrogenase